MGVELTDKVAIVTGAAQGIGEATAKKLAERGASVVGLDKQGDLLGRVMAGIPRGVASRAFPTRVDRGRPYALPLSRRRGSSAERRPSPSILRPSTVAKMAAPGKSDSHGARSMYW